jgi:hypothetical protein
MKSNLENLKNNFEMKMKKEENLDQLDEQLNFEAETVGEILSVQDRVAIVTSLENVRGGVRGGELGGYRYRLLSKNTPVFLSRGLHSFRKNILLPIVFSKAYFHTIVDDDTFISKVRRLAIRFLDFYEKVLELLLRIPVVKQLIIAYIYFISLIRAAGFKLGDSMDRATLNLYVLLVVSFLHKLGLGWYVMTGCILFLAIDNHGIFIAKFYKKRPGLFNLHFGPITASPTPSGAGGGGGIPPRRSMFTAAKALASKIASEAANNSLTTAVGTAVVGGITWKLLDIHDTNKQEDLQEKQIEAEKKLQEKQIEADTAAKDKEIAANAAAQANQIEAEARERQKDRDAENIRHKESLDAAYRQHKETLEAEAIERQKDREAKM